MSPQPKNTVPNTGPSSHPQTGREQLQTIRRYHNNSITKYIAIFCEKFNRAYYHEDNGDMRSNGELYLLKIFSLYHTTPVFFLDIGANKGEWTDALLDNFQEARGLCFEIILTFLISYLCTTLRIRLLRYIHWVCRQNPVMWIFNGTKRSTRRRLFHLG